jgi:hypothetical protein
MLDLIFFYGVLAALVLLAIGSSALLICHRKNAAKLVQSTDMMESRVYMAVAEKYGAAPNLVAECLRPERKAISAAMTHCDSCGSVEECRHFFDQPGSNVDEAREFCPNTSLFIELAEKLRREVKI